MNNTEDNKPGSLKRVVSPRPFEPGETIFHRSHGGSAVIVEITAKGLALRHPSGAIRKNKWSSLFMWSRKGFRPVWYGDAKRDIEATRELANDSRSATGANEKDEGKTR